MAKLTVTTNEGVVVEQIDCDEWDLHKPIARAAFHQEVDEAINRAKEIDQT
jgi:hypothetical protein